MKHPYFLLISFVLGSFLVSSCGSKPEAPVNLRCEYQENPLGIDTRNPRFSWSMSDTLRCAKQTAYEVLVASNEGQLEKDNGDIWNSGKVKSGQSQFITFEGAALKSASRYFWKVRTWNKNHRASEWSAPHWFETGLYAKEDWQAKWIAAQKAKDVFPPRSVILRKTFNIDKNVARARLYITGLGNYQAYLNGRKVGFDLFTPGWTNYPTRIQYQVFDVTNQVKDGGNALGVILGNMWWSSGLGWQGGAAYSKGPLRMLAQLAINFSDGTSTMISSDESWKFTDSPILYNHIYNGETYDARLEIPHWADAGLVDSTWNTVTVLDTMKAQLTADQGPAIQATEELDPVSITQPKPGTYVFDLGQNMVGWARLIVQGKAGDKVEMRFAELLHPDGTVAQENLRSAKATDVYILKGSEPETWEPKFTYHGFRYVQVTGLSSKPDTSTITGVVIHSAAPVSGKFACSNGLLDTIYRNITWGQKGNMMSVPTDCPQRDERLGWMGDAQIFATTACYSRNMDQFFAKWLKDIDDCQDTSGYVYDVNPAIVVGGPAKPAWGDALVMVPYDTYEFYGDKRIIADNYEAMKKWVNYMKKNSKDGIYEFGNTDWGGYGDWVAAEASPTKPIGTAYYYYSSKLLSKMAGVLNDTTEQRILTDQAKSAAEAYQKKYFIDSVKNYIGRTQTMNVLPFMFGITPDNLKETVLENVIKNVHDRKDHLSTGFLGTKYLLPMLSENGQNELAYTIASQTTYPSWGYMVEKGATTMWELWNSDTERPDQMNSRNHFAYGSVGQWYFQYLAGIRPDFDQPGFKHTLIAPIPAGNLTWAEASLHTGYGLLSSRWDRKDGVFTLNLLIPANTTATVKLPVPEGKEFTITESGRKIFEKGKVAGKSKDVQFANSEKNSVTFAISSGRYLFTVK